MKNLSLILLIVLSIASCTKEEQCPAEDFIGSYMGDTECLLGLTSMTDATVTVEKKSDKELTIIFQNQNIPVDIKGCETEVDDAIILGTGLEGEASFDGDQITVSYTVKAAGIAVESCTFVGTKQ